MRLAVGRRGTLPFMPPWPLASAEDEAVNGTLKTHETYRDGSQRERRIVLIGIWTMLYSVFPLQHVKVTRTDY